MLRLGETRDEVGVVADQLGNPTNALDIADALLVIARRMTQDPAPALRGVFNLTGQGEASWADLAEATFEIAEHCGRKPVHVRRIATADYPTPARRPANSRLDNAKLAEHYGLALPPWRQSLEGCVTRLLREAR
jgi:dTDP-4-dehydrorhamnose reductase